MSTRFALRYLMTVGALVGGVVTIPQGMTGTVLPGKRVGKNKAVFAR